MMIITSLSGDVIGEAITGWSAKASPNSTMAKLETTPERTDRCRGLRRTYKPATVQTARAEPANAVP